MTTPLYIYIDKETGPTGTTVENGVNGTTGPAAGMRNMQRNAPTDESRDGR